MRITNKYIVLALLVCCELCSALAGYAQTTTLATDHQNKYWYFRYKLRNDFMIIGEGAGKSQPAAVRNRLGTHLRWSDATIFMGWYLGVLGTEYKLLLNSGDSHGREMNKTELYYALKAMDRLDYVAETHPNSGGSPSYNGYFTRDDIPTDFYQTYGDRLNSSYTFEDSIDTITGDWHSSGPEHEMSRDQAIHVLMGLKLVWIHTNYYMDIKLSDGTTVNNVNPGLWARDIAIRIIDHVRSIVGIRNPITGMLVDRGNINVDIRWPLKQLKNEMLNQPLQLLSGPDYSHWQGGFTIATGAKNTHQVLILAAICENAKSRVNVGTKADKYNWKNFYHMLYDEALNKGYGPHWDALSHLSDAPCDGISHGMSGAVNNSAEWHATHRYIKDDNDQKYGQQSGTLTGYFTGLDYMLLHNLYRLRRDYAFSDHFLNRIDHKISGYPSGTVKSGAFHKITSDALIMSNANVEHRAGVEIELVPGFATGVNTEYVAYVAPYNCTPGFYHKKGSDDYGLYGMPLPDISEVVIEQGEALAIQGAAVEKNIFPNPTSSILNLSGFTAGTDLILTDINGKTVLRQEIGESAQLNIEHLSEGIYLLRVSEPSGEASYEKIVVQH